MKRKYKICVACEKSIHPVKPIRHSLYETQCRKCHCSLDPNRSVNYARIIEVDIKRKDKILGYLPIESIRNLVINFQPTELVTADFCIEVSDDILKILYGIIDQQNRRFQRVP